MSNSPRQRQTKWILSALVLLPFVVLCVGYLDRPVALWVQRNLYRNAHWSRATTSLPDLLLIVVLVTTGTASALYLVRVRKGLYGDATSCCRLLAWTGPAAYLAKGVLKFAFGRVNTRVFLQDPALYGFHWFQRRPGCEGFPSGHMLVTVALLACVERFFPRLRPLAGTAALLLGAALVATNYHFLSDVVAGGYLGALVEAVLFGVLFRGGPFGA